ncbi:hypothetical protein BTA51_27100 [Hahella sp. CCB-MM4]|nr:hypothetical protein BTA51_27100 [Hahella sp. CCB-MM4]
MEREHWVVNHRVGSIYPGYLMVASRQRVSDIWELNQESLAQLGPVLAEVERSVRLVYQPYKVLVCKLGFSKGFDCHFHVIPVHDWVLSEIASHHYYSNEPDGNDVMLYINREYCENQCLEKSSRIALNAAAEIKNILKP